jgi:tryptophanyl-tRNA synthetase
MKAIVRNMVTDPARIRRTDPGNPDICPVGDYHDVFSEKNRVAEVDHGCRTAGIGCVECKMWLFESLRNRLGPFYERRRELESHPDDVMDILNEGSKKASAVAGETMAEVRRAIKI